MDSADHEAAKEIYRRKEDAQKTLEKYYQEYCEDYREYNNDDFDPFDFDFDDYYDYYTDEEEEQRERRSDLAYEIDDLASSIRDMNKVMKKTSDASVKKTLQKEANDLQAKLNALEKEKKDLETAFETNFPANHPSVKVNVIGCCPNDYHNKNGFCISTCYDEDECIHSVSGTIKKVRLY